jgi:hypothetical protein
LGPIAKAPEENRTTFFGGVPLCAASFHVPLTTRVFRVAVRPCEHVRGDFEASLLQGERRKHITPSHMITIIYIHLYHLYPFYRHTNTHTHIYIIYPLNSPFIIFPIVRAWEHTERHSKHRWIMVISLLPTGVNPGCLPLLLRSSWSC